MRKFVCFVIFVSLLVSCSVRAKPFWRRARNCSRSAAPTRGRRECGTKIGNFGLVPADADGPERRIYVRVGAGRRLPVIAKSSGFSPLHQGFTLASDTPPCCISNLRSPRSARQLW